MIIISIIILLLLITSFMFAFEVALFTCSHFVLELDEKNGNFNAKLVNRLLKQHNKSFNSIIIVRNILIFSIVILSLNLIFLQNFITVNSFFSEIIVFIIFITLVFVAFIILTNLIVALNANEIVKSFVIPYNILVFVLQPIIRITNFIKKIVISNAENNDQHLIEFNISPLNPNLEKMEQSSKTEDHEMQMIQNVIDFTNVRIRECMIPRTEIVSVNSEDSIIDLKKIFTESGLSKIIVYQTSLDNIIGYVHSYDLFKNPQSIKSILRPILIVPETMQASQLLSTLINQHKSIAIVVDEFGGTSGMLTLEDVMEEIFGEINDELDENELIEKKINQNEYVFSARLEIEYLNEKYNLNLPESEDYKTLNGLIFDFYENIPKKGNFIKIEKFYFQILEVSETRIELVKLKIIHQKK